MIDKDWLKSLKVGDEFVMSQGWGNSLGSRHKITRETNTRFFYEINERCEGWFHKETGETARSGGRFSVSQSVSPVTDEFNYKDERRSLIYKLNSLISAGFKGIGNEDIKGIIKIMENKK